MNKSVIKDLIQECFCAGVVSGTELAKFLGYERKTLNTAKNKGQLKQIDRGVFKLEDVVEWLYTNPRYLSRINNK